MQRLDKYGLITLVFLLVTLIAVVVWGDGHADKLKGLLVSADGPADAANPGQLLSPKPAGKQQPRNQASRSTVAPKDQLRLASKSEPTLRRPPLSNAGRSSSAKAKANRELKVAKRREPAPAEQPKSKPVSVRSEPERRDPRPQPQPSLQKYVVQAGDTLSEIAQAQLGSSKRWREIIELNPGVDSAHLHVGQRLELPGKSTVAQRSDSRTQPRREQRPIQGASKAGQYVVQPGDTLSGIAQAELGSARRWKSIVDANPGLDPQRLVVGQSLRLPDGAPASGGKSNDRARARNLVAAAPKKLSGGRSKVQ